MNKEFLCHYINNQWISGSGYEFSSFNPANGQVIWNGNAADKDEVNNAVNAAHQAFNAWSNLSLSAREVFLDRFKSELTKQRESLAEIISQDTGKPLWESQAEVAAMIGKIPTSIEGYHERCKFREIPTANAKIVTRHRPHGVIGIFAPFNFPVHLSQGQIIPALLAGNTIVLKGSEHTPLASEAIMKCWEKAELPKGVINLIQGGPDTGHFLAVHSKIDGLFFTGSYTTGKIIADELINHPEKILALEMGGNNPLVVVDTHDPIAAAYITIQSSYISSGQRCNCARRLIVVETEENNVFIKTLINMIKSIKVGFYHSRPEPFMGPVISISAMEKLLATQATLGAQGGLPLVEMRCLKEGSSLLSPGLMDVTHINHRQDEEFFGPFLQLIRVQNFQEALEEANRTHYGLCAGLISQNAEFYKEFLQNIRAGIVHWNNPITGTSSKVPYGGVKKSGNHRPGGYYAADYCSYPVSSFESEQLHLPKTLIPGIKF